MHDQCISARNDHYTGFWYWGPSTFISGMKMVHRGDRIECHPASYTRWGCHTRDHGDINIVVTGKVIKIYICLVHNISRNVPCISRRWIVRGGRHLHRQFQELIACTRMPKRKVSFISNASVQFSTLYEPMHGSCVWKEQVTKTFRKS
jgi:hypothetical protein